MLGMRRNCDQQFFLWGAMHTERAFRRLLILSMNHAELMIYFIVFSLAAGFART